MMRQFELQSPLEINDITPNPWLEMHVNLNVPTRKIFVCQK